jgi:hypothetical protein
VLLGVEGPVASRPNVSRDLLDPTPKGQRLRCRMIEETTVPLRGSCHCGKIAYRLDDEPVEAMACNCSICRRKGYLLAFSTPDRFHLETSRDDIAVYTFGRHTIRHQFCRACGCAPFGEGVGPDGKPMVAVNLRCADRVDLSSIAITPFDGASL